MNKILYVLCAAAMLASCSTSFSIKGSSDVQNLDGHMLYLKDVAGEDVKTIDSCDVVHGQFSFHGALDTIKVGALFMNDESVMPVVLEEGDIVIKFNNAQQTCSGTPLNDKLAEFIERYNQINNQIGDLQHQHDQAIMDGEDMESVSKQLQIKYEQLNGECDECVTKFIEENFDNVLGPFVFRMVTGSMEIPLTNAWIDALMIKASDTFKNDKYVKDFMEAAQKNQAIMTGMEEVEPQLPVALPETNGVPTPNQLAQPENAKKE